MTPSMWENYCPKFAYMVEYFDKLRNLSFDSHKLLIRTIINQVVFAQFDCSSANEISSSQDEGKEKEKRRERGNGRKEGEMEHQSGKRNVLVAERHENWREQKWKEINWLLDGFFVVMVAWFKHLICLLMVDIV